jgi:ubiquinone/menaquinone biosynthesis C-methylase UbiE
LLNGFDKIATFYDWIAYLAYGSQLTKIQNLLITELPESGRILILGGGSGKILPTIFEHAPSLEIIYLEASGKMIELARKNAPASMHIEFVHSDDWMNMEDEIIAVYAGFFLSCFSEDLIRKGIRQLAAAQNPSLKWFVADFDANQLKGLWNYIRLKMSIIFFRIFAGLKLKKLEPLFHVFEELGYRSLQTRRLQNQSITFQILCLSSH